MLLQIEMIYIYISIYLQGYSVALVVRLPTHAQMLTSKFQCEVLGLRAKPCWGLSPVSRGEVRNAL